MQLVGFIAACVAPVLGLTAPPWEKIEGRWQAYQTPQSVLGPLSVNRTMPFAVLDSFDAARDPQTGEHWMSFLQGQVWRIHTNNSYVQYCFNGEAITKSMGITLPSVPGYGIPSESMPFLVDSFDENNVVLCFRSSPECPRLPTHKADCWGCDCVKITIELSDNHLTFTAFMSPPVIHARAWMVRVGKGPSMKFFRNYQRNTKCEFANRTGALPKKHLLPAPGVAAEPSSGDVAEAVVNMVSSLCPLGYVSKAKRANQAHLLLANGTTNGTTLGANGPIPVPYPSKWCLQLNGLNKFDEHRNKDIRDVRVQKKMPGTPCYPCKVKYSVSALIADNEYIAIGFKGLDYWTGLVPGFGKSSIKKARGNYFGMTNDDWDMELTDRIILAYVSNGKPCVREMRSPEYAGLPIDVAEGSKIVTDMHVKRENGRTVFRFQIPQHWGLSPVGASWTAFFMRIAWGIGAVTPAADEQLTSGAHQLDTCNDCGNAYHEQWTNSSRKRRVWMDGHGVAEEEGNGICNDNLGFHGMNRGVSPEWWFAQNLPCLWHSGDWDFRGGQAEGDVISV